MAGEAMKEFLRQADTVAQDTAHRGLVAFDRAFVARLAADLRVVAALFTMLEKETVRVTEARKKREPSSVPLANRDCGDEDDARRKGRQ